MWIPAYLCYQFDEIADSAIMCCSSRILLLIVICVGCLQTCSYAQWVFDDEGCRTPNRGTGNCIPLKECQPMVEVLEKLERPISGAILKRLQAYTCGPNGNSVKVCCPQGPIILEPIGTSETNTEPPDVSNHRNIRLLPKDCGYLNPDNRIINGEDAAINEFPWMALIRYRGTKTGGLLFKCGGTIINKNYILTAAHCISALTNSKLDIVRVGEHSIKNETDCEIVNRKLKCNPPVQDLRIEQIIPHPKFGSRTFLNDIGLIRVSTMNLNVENVRPVCLPLGRERTKAFDSVFVTGWGVTNTNTGETSDILQKVKLPVADKNSCTNTYNNNNIKLVQSQLCAGGVQNKDSCPGDSGGPMMVTSINQELTAVYVQQGIVSFGPKYCGIPGYPGVYTLTKYYMDWILDNLRP